jgi:short subunit dehydrogenase-like uncharacterized protein
MKDLESTPPSKLLIYGASGFTGNLIVHEAAREASTSKSPAEMKIS